MKNIVQNIASLSKNCDVLSDVWGFRILQLFYWPSTTNYQLQPPSTDPVPSYINQYHSIMTQYHQVSIRTNLYCCCLGLQTSAQFTPGLVLFYFAFLLWTLFLLACSQRRLSFCWDLSLFRFLSSLPLP